MKKSDDAIPCRLTGPDGKVMWGGTIADLRRDARKLREMDAQRKDEEREKKEAPDAVD
jgi:hypothetical protein